MNNTEIKNATLSLYNSLSQLKIVRQMQMTRWDESSGHWVVVKQPEMYPEVVNIRDEIIDLNSAFFGYIAKNTFLNNSYISYDDKYQSAVTNFCECWWWYKWKGDYSHKGYRQDISFSVFFKPRIAEMLEREFNEVKYSIRRTLCMKVGDQLVPKKHWGKVTLEDLSDPNVRLTVEEMNSLKAMFGSLYPEPIEDHESYIFGDDRYESKYDNPLSNEYNSLEELLIHYLVTYERDLTDADLENIAETHSIGQILIQERSENLADLTDKDINYIGFLELKSKLPKAKELLHQDLKQSLMQKRAFTE